MWFLNKTTPLLVTLKHKNKKINVKIEEIQIVKINPILYKKIQSVLFARTC